MTPLSVGCSQPPARRPIMALWRLGYRAAHPRLWRNLGVIPRQSVMDSLRLAADDRGGARSDQVEAYAGPGGHDSGPVCRAAAAPRGAVRARHWLRRLGWTLLLRRRGQVSVSQLRAACDGVEAEA